MRTNSWLEAERGDLRATLRTMLLLFLALCLLVPVAYSQGPPPAPPPQSPAREEAAAENTDPDCNNPLPGQTARLVGDDEIMLVYRDGVSPTYVRNMVIDKVNGVLTNVHDKAYSTLPNLASASWLSAAAADLDGDRKAELFAGFKNVDQDLGAIADPFSNFPDCDWYCSNDRENGGKLQDVDVAAGDLDRRGNDDEVVIVFRDDLEDFHIRVQDGNSAGTIGNPVNYSSSNLFYDSYERGNIWHASAATGDLNGDGYDDEIITAFKDSGKDLQVHVHRRQDDGSLCSIMLYDSYSATPQFDTVADICGLVPCWDNRRPIDVTTGDLDGDMQDEVVVAFRNGDCDHSNITLLVLDVIGEFPFWPDDVLLYTDDVYTTIDLIGGGSYSAPTVSVSAADLDGDGYDEVAVGYDNQYVRNDADDFHHQQSLVTFDYLPNGAPEWQLRCGSTGMSCLSRRPGQYWSDVTTYNSSEGDNDARAHVSIATGDLDRDGTAEVALARLNPGSGAVEVRAFDADANATNGLAQHGNTVTVDLHPSTGDDIWDFALAMGDYDGNSIWGQYNGNCRTKKDALVQAVLHAPPYWPEGRGQNGCDNDYRTMAEFGMHVDQETGVGTELETTLGGTAQVSTPFKAITASFGREWEHSTFVSEEQTTTTMAQVGTETTPPLNAGDGEPSYETVLLIESGKWCYDYTNFELGTMPVCVPRPDLTYHNAKKISWWYESGPAYYGDTWVPVGLNLAEDSARTQRIASQSSTYAGPPSGDAWRAVDGVTNGTYSAGSVSQTMNDPYPWWQVDMGGLQWIDGVQIWNRTDNQDVQDRLKNYYLFVTDGAAFPSNDPNVLKSHPDVWFHHYETGPVAETVTIPVHGYGRLVRVQLDHPDYLNLAEVQVYGMPGTPDQWPEAISPSSLSAPATSFTLTWRNGREQVVNRPLYLVWNTPYFLTDQGSTDLNFLTGVGGSRQTVQGSGDSLKLTVGLETKRSREGSFGVSQKRWSATTWGAGVEFGGTVQGMGDAAPRTLDYTWAPYVWLQEAVPAEGGKQEFLVMDYFVPQANVITDPWPTDEDLCPGTAEKVLSSGPLAAPQAPQIQSPTHPDPDTWYDSNTVTFTWHQPSGDPATIDTYDWALDRNPDTVPAGFHRGLETSQTYDPLNDGIWYLHVRAMGDGGVWGDTGHRMIRVDAKPPQVSLGLDPPRPAGQSDWYVTPVNVTVSATDTLGSGVTGVEVSTDGATWQPYSAPLALSADTPATTVYARAADAVGNLSEPVSTTVKIDSTPPDSHVAGGAGPGTWVAEVRTNAVGNEVLVLAGAITDDVSGRHGMDLQFDGVDGTGPTTIGSWYPFPDQPSIEVNWYYTATHQLGAGYHIVTGRAFDGAGNQEETYEIGRVLWLPKASPDVGGSSVAASQTTARPGDEIRFDLVARNAGFQEAHVAVTDTLPEGLSPIVEALPEDVDYDPATRTLTWPPRLLWPGQWERHSFLARVDAGLGATVLENQATFHAFWPNTDLLPEAERQPFLDREQTVVARATVAVNPDLSAGADITPPWALLAPLPTQIADGAEVSLHALAAPDARWMYLREWTPDPVTGAWTVAQNSGWIDFNPDPTWTLSGGQGVRYLGLWVADGAGNISTLSERSLTFVNRMDASQVLAGGQRVQYRGLLQGGESVSGFLKTVSGDPDGYVWKPRNAFWPDHHTTDTLLPGQVEEFCNQFEMEAGRYLLEVQAVGASEYELSLTREGSEEVAASSVPLENALEKSLPEHPLTVSDPLSAGQLGPEVSLPLNSYLPLVFRNR